MLNILVGFEVKKCKGGGAMVEDDSCDTFLHLSDGLDACTILNSTIFGVQRVINNFKPIPSCPFKKGVYLGRSMPNLQDVIK